MNKTNNRKTLNRVFWIGVIPFLIIGILSVVGVFAYVSQRTHDFEEVVEKPIRDTVVVEKEVIRYIDTQPKTTYIPKPRVEQIKPVIDTPIKNDSL